jgi:hypothetical protein
LKKGKNDLGQAEIEPTAFRAKTRDTTTQLPFRGEYGGKGGKKSGFCAKVQDYCVGGGVHIERRSCAGVKIANIFPRSTYSPPFMYFFQFFPHCEGVLNPFTSPYALKKIFPSLRRSGILTPYPICIPATITFL